MELNRGEEFWYFHINSLYLNTEKFTSTVGHYNIDLVHDYVLSVEVFPRETIVFGEQGSKLLLSQVAGRTRDEAFSNLKDSLEMWGKFKGDDEHGQA